tara:strand:- start:450 stop:674 length:225 start_codon:yes stop_codon:yes gene_type:complete
MINKEEDPNPNANANANANAESESDCNLLEKYLNTFSEQDKLAMKIAINQLESSFSLEKSIGFLEFKKNYKKKD